MSRRFVVLCGDVVVGHGMLWCPCLSFKWVSEEWEGRSLVELAQEMVGRLMVAVVWRVAWW